MHKRPLLLIFYSSLFLYFPLEWGIRLYLGKEFVWGEALLFGFFPLILIAGLLRVSKMGWYTLVALIALWGVQDLNVFYSSRGKAWGFLSHFGIYLFSLSYFINPRIRHLYFDPKLRWWRTKPRFETYLPLIVKRGEQWDYPTMRNISEGGCFIETTQLGAVSDVIYLNIPLPVPLPISMIQVAGEVRWICDSESKQGMGIQFNHLAGKDLSAIKEFVRRGL